jgi:hypothetical protein
MGEGILVTDQKRRRPALWETDDILWPQNGEVDILEGINDQAPNQVTLHTTPNCTMPDTNNVNGTSDSPYTASRIQTGQTLTTDCDYETNWNEGCIVGASGMETYGPGFNLAGGGWYVLERNSTGVYVWFWSRLLGLDVPPAVTALSSSSKSSPPPSTIDTSAFGIPLASFPTTPQCTVPEHFGPNSIIINLTFCGLRAGAEDVYPKSGCPGTCKTYVEENPEAFVEAYWDIRGIWVFE